MAFYILQRWKWVDPLPSLVVTFPLGVVDCFCELPLTHFLLRNFGNFEIYPKCMLNCPPLENKFRKPSLVGHLSPVQLEERAKRVR